MRELLRDIIRRGLRPLEPLVLRGVEALPFPPIFIVSPPRSGSTLLYLLAAQKFYLSYFSNFSVMCPESPAVLTLLAAPFGACSGGTTLENSFGETSDWNAPNQAYRVWNRWFPTDRDYIDPHEIGRPSRREMRRTIGAIERVTGSPFINKWQRNATRVQALRAVFPEALFLQLRRNPILTVQSILSARQRLLQDDRAWFSAMPRSYVQDPGKSALQRAAEQVALLEMDLEQDKKLVGEDRFFLVRYEDLCRNSDAALDAFASWYQGRTGIALRVRQNLGIELTENRSVSMSSAEIAEIKNIFEALGFAAESSV